MLAYVTVACVSAIAALAYCGKVRLRVKLHTG